MSGLYLSVLFIPLLFGLYNLGYAFCYEEAGRIYDISPELLRAIAITETGENPEAININQNGTSDLGLMQINSSWIPVLNLDRNALITDPCYNVKVGAWILRNCMDLYGYTWDAVGCYNAKSLSKKIRYSWKVYKTLNKIKGRKQKRDEPY